MPPNCSFELDDIEKEWTWTRPFDLIFSRTITGCLQNTEDFIKQAYKYECLSYIPTYLYTRATYLTSGGGCFPLRFLQSLKTARTHTHTLIRL